MKLLCGGSVEKVGKKQEWRTSRNRATKKVGECEPGKSVQETEAR